MRPHSLRCFLLSLVACGAPQAPAPVAEPHPDPEPRRHDEEAAVEAPALGVEALSLDELRSLAESLTLREAGRRAFVADEELVLLEGPRFFVYEDLGELELGRGCRGLPGTSEGAELMLEVLGRRERNGDRPFHEIVFRDGVMLTGGGVRGPDGTSAFGGATWLDYALVRSNADRRIYSTSAEFRRLQCAPGQRTVDCPDGGVSSCSVMLPAVVATSAVPNTHHGVAGTMSGSVSGGPTCRLSCAENACDEALGPPQLRQIRTVFRPEGAVIAVFRTRSACRAFARERAPLIQRVRAERGECDCSSCSDGDGACVTQCEVACETADQAVIDADEDVEAPAPPHLFRAEVAITQPVSQVHGASVTTLVESLRSCIGDALRDTDPELHPRGTVVRQDVTWTIGADGSLTNVASASATALTGPCLAAARAERFQPGEESTFQTSHRAVIGPAPP